MPVTKARVALAVLALTLSVVPVYAQPLTQSERDSLTKHLQQTRQALQIRLIDGMTIRELAAGVTGSTPRAQQREARFDVPLPLAVQPFRLLFADFVDQRREIDAQRPPGELVCLVECAGTAFVRPLKHEAERSKSECPAIALPARIDVSDRGCGQSFADVCPGRMNGPNAAPSHRIARDGHR